LKDTQRWSFDTIFPNIFGEPMSYRLRSDDVCILCFDVYFGMKSETAAQRIIIDFGGSIDLIFYIPRR
jgi:hypothetical protein